MSKTEAHKGIAVEYATHAKGFREKIEWVKTNGIDIEVEDFEFEEIKSPNWVWIAGRLFNIEDRTFDYEECIEAQKLGVSGSYEYTLIFYNGGGSFDEALTAAILKADSE